MTSKYFTRRKPLKTPKDEYMRFYGPVAKPHMEAELDDSE